MDLAKQKESTSQRDWANLFYQGDGDSSLTKKN